jgi:hypothetical protein
MQARSFVLRHTQTIGSERKRELSKLPGIGSGELGPDATLDRVMGIGCNRAAVNTDRSHNQLLSITYTRDVAISTDRLATWKHREIVQRYLLIAVSAVDTMQHTNFEDLRRAGPSLPTSILLNAQKYVLLEITAVQSLFREECS